MHKTDILQAFQIRVENDSDTEFAEACRQVEKIALLRLRDKLWGTNLTQRTIIPNNQFFREQGRQGAKDNIPCSAWGIAATIKKAG